MYLRFWCRSVIKSSRMLAILLSAGSPLLYTVTVLLLHLLRDLGRILPKPRLRCSPSSVVVHRSRLLFFPQNVENFLQSVVIFDFFSHSITSNPLVRYFKTSLTCSFSCQVVYLQFLFWSVVKYGRETAILKLPIALCFSTFLSCFCISSKTFRQIF